jgi:hypothetical protein
MMSLTRGMVAGALVLRSMVQRQLFGNVPLGATTGV